MAQEKYIEIPPFAKLVSLKLPKFTNSVIKMMLFVHGGIKKNEMVVKWQQILPERIYNSHYGNGVFGNVYLSAGQH